ncbi:hypothetical protein ABT299_15880 [Spirillospora sp. NPDC000708]
MATKSAEAGKAELKQNEVGPEDGDEKRYVVTEQELEDLKELKAVRLALRMIHSLDRCPRCTESFQELWKDRSNGEWYTAQALAWFAASMVDDVAELHKSSDAVEAANEARLNTLHEYAGLFLTHAHGCTDGHTGCAPANPT